MFIAYMLEPRYSRVYQGYEKDSKKKGEEMGFNLRSPSIFSLRLKPRRSRRRRTKKGV